MQTLALSLGNNKFQRESLYFGKEVSGMEKGKSTNNSLPIPLGNRRNKVLYSELFSDKYKYL